MKSKTIAFLIIGFLIFLGRAIYVYARSGYESVMMRNMMNGGYNYKNEDYSAKSYTNAKLSEDAKISTNPQLKNQKNTYYVSRFLESIKKGNNN
jgi:hypothetical protein